jgi:hypothetical protein
MKIKPKNLRGVSAAVEWGERPPRQARSDDWSNVITEAGERLAAAVAAKRA